MLVFLGVYRSIFGMEVPTKVESFSDCFLEIYVFFLVKLESCHHFDDPHLFATFL